MIELADDPTAARNISAGGVFVPGCTLPINSDCTLLVRGPMEELELVARVVYVDAKKGAGLELANFTPAMREHVTRIMTAWATPTDTPAADADAGEPEPEPGGDIPDEPELTDEEKADPVKRKHVQSLHERLRGLSLAQQIKAASSPDPQERILLERFYNKNVWEPLLRNPRLTPPEVARLARLGSLPKPLLEIIVSNGAWLQMPEVRRALLQNPRLSADQVMRILRLLPKPELKLATTQTAYPFTVRDCARRLMKEHLGNK